MKGNAMNNRTFANKLKITKRAASKARAGKQRNNPRSPYFGLTLRADLEKRGAQIGPVNADTLK